MAMAKQSQQRNAYNGRGERVLRSADAGGNAPALPSSAGDWSQPQLRASVYDESGQLLSTLHGGATPRHEDIVWLDQTPIARIDSTAAGITRADLIHSDHLNSPRALSHAIAQDNQPAGTVSWRWKLVDQTPNPSPAQPASNAFGALAPQEDADGNGTTVTLDLRFPGQQADSAIGVYYNYFRDYEAATGRYVESDPIGLAGGISSFGYVAASPIRDTDKRGLSTGGGAGIAILGRCVLGAAGGYFTNTAMQTLKCCWKSCDGEISGLRKCNVLACIKSADGCEQMTAAAAGCLVGTFRPEMSILAGAFAKEIMRAFHLCDYLPPSPNEER